MSPELITLISTYGYIAVFLGSLIEGEAVLVIASFLSYLNELELPLVLLAAFAGTLLSDISWFILGRHSNDKYLNRWQWLRTMSDHSISVVGKRPRMAAFLMRFMYGFRVIVPFSLGKTSISFVTYLVYNALGVFLWVGIFSFLGYFFASTIDTFFGRVHHLEIIILVTVVAIILVATHFNRILKPRIERFFQS
jgi:membrane protein DedA with SNARE-associated domain